MPLVDRIVAMLLVSSLHHATASSPNSDTPSPPVWPERFHAVLFQNRSNSLSFVDLYYDWTKGRNLNLIRGQHDDDQGSAGELWDVEFGNKTSYYYFPRTKSCKKMEFPVGILIPNWLDNATFLGTEQVDGYPCNVWTKADGFITYWEDIATTKPVKWTFGSGMEEHVMKWVINETLPDEQWEIPSYCSQDSMLLRNNNDPKRDEAKKKAYTSRRFLP
eukprot:CAMPEP_0185251418 /NCGR_PEP_ID=MMETSP1359-20130426/830_1 /TAXON_ID=552665 /ORGANISM="Bigelowiella longifila, Strain CCMP242" /LENGTH=217 /DNA_ID=CAMNT_0027833319 /DNA_START=22 /DNA_END=675 /DNA_ORIENTATION=+